MCASKVRWHRTGSHPFPFVIQKESLANTHSPALQFEVAIDPFGVTKVLGNDLHLNSDDRLRSPRLMSYYAAIVHCRSPASSFTLPHHEGRSEGFVISRNLVADL